MAKAAKDLPPTPSTPTSTARGPVRSGRGRPVSMTLRPDATEDRLLNQLAARWHVSKQAAALRAIRETAIRESGIAEVEAITLQILEQDADALAKLADS